MSPPEIIKAVGFTLRRATVMHAPALFRCCWSDREVMRYQDFPILRNLSQAISRLEHFHEAWDEEQEFHWAVTLDHQGQEEPVGCVLLSRKTPEKYSLGYALDKALWGHGYMTNAVQLVLDVAFYHFKATSVQGTCSRNNRASARVLEKLGFSHTRAWLNAHELCNLPASMTRVVDQYTLQNRQFFAARPSS